MGQSDDMRSGYEQAKADAVKIIEAKLPHYGEAYERLLIDVRDEINAMQQPAGE
jgi:hypothetical protein